MQRFLDMVENNVGSSELDADEINHGALSDEQAYIEVSPSLKIGNKNKNRTRNFNEENILLALAWLEVSMDPVQSDQNHNTY